ncbi:hypothetical protein FACS189451_07450 [Bacteroidia bacterium]|nr:hypothetical protein FACS189451_07450 [Bacteroidia bacterium]
MKKMLFLMLFLMILGTVSVCAQVTIGDNKAPENYSALEIISNGSNALRLPQLTTAQRDAMTTADFQSDEKSFGLVIYNLTTNCFDFWNGSVWISLCAPTSIDLSCGTVLSQGSPVAVGGVPSEIVGVMPATGGTAPYTYLWQSCTGNPAVPGNWGTATGSTAGANYQPAALNNTTYFRRQVTDAVGATCVSNVVNVQVTLVAGTITQPAELPIGGGTVTINGTPSTGGFSGTVYRQWEYCLSGCNDEDNWYAVTDNTGGYACTNDGTGLNYASCSITGDMQIRRRDMDGEQAQVTNTVLVTVRTSNPTGSATDMNGSYTGGAVCQDSPASFTVTLVPAVTNPVVIVYDSNGNEVAQDNAAPFTFTVNPPTVPETNYYVAFKGSNYDENLPGDRKQIAIPVTAKLTPSVSITASATTITSGTQVTFTAAAINGGTSPTYNWYKNNSLVSSGKSNTWVNSSLVNGDDISCDIVSNLTCVTSAISPRSNHVIITVPLTKDSSCEGCRNFLQSIGYEDLPYYTWASGWCSATSGLSGSITA